MKKTKKQKKQPKMSRDPEAMNRVFKTVVTSFIGLFLAFCIIIVSSPREDLQKRGFIPCTETMIAELHDCEGIVWCTVKAILKNAACDFKVIKKGFGGWLRGEQETPWANYLFAAEKEDDFEEILRQFYDENPDIAGEMRRLKELHEELENAIRKIEAKE